jgi:hypothetical protein
MRRRAGRRPVVAAQGDLLIDGRLRARLLGLPLLDVDVQVVVAPARPALTVPPVAADRTGLPGRPESRSRWAAARTVAGTDESSPPQLARAVRLIAEGSTALDEARRIR